MVALWFSVEVEVATPPLGEETVESLFALLSARGNCRAVSVAAGDVLGGLEARFIVSDAGGMTESISTVEAVMDNLLPPGWTLERVEVMTDRKVNDVVSKPRYVGVTEIGKLLGVSRQRVDQLRREHPDFPPPDAELAAGPIWRASKLRGFLGSWERRPGRPKRDVFGNVRRRGEFYLVPSWAVATTPEFGWIKDGVDVGIYGVQSTHHDGRDAFVPVPIVDFDRRLGDVMHRVAQHPVAFAMRRSLDDRLGDGLSWKEDEK